MSLNVGEYCETQFVWEDSTLYLMARITGAAAANIVQADVSSIALVVTKKGSTPGSPSALTVATVIFNTLQTDARWTVDATGYNFRHEVAHTVLAEKGVYLFDVKLVLTGGQRARFGFKVPVNEVQG